MTMYDEAFFVEEGRSALSAAEAVVPSVIAATKATTVIDVGCGTGAWASVAKRLGCRVVGVDGYAPANQLMIDQDEFRQEGLIEGVSCSGFDLALCLEVGEHLPESSAAALVAGLCEARYVLWSAAIPGQHGVDHINEQWSTWWEPFFASHGYSGSCDIRNEFWLDRRVAGFYRQNMIVWATWEDLTLAGYRKGVRDEIHPDRALGF
jgi:SAM-dependent methyltransferase